MRIYRIVAVSIALVLCGGVLSLKSFAAEEEASASEQKSAAGAKKKGYDYEKSKYKSLTESEPKSYKFDAKGNPIPPAAKKKTAKKPVASKSAE